MAENVYDHDGPPPDGWKNVSDDPAALDAIGLKPDDLAAPGSEFRAQVYAPDPAVFGDDMKPTVAFQGTRPEADEDWANNVAQGRDQESLYYRKAVGIGNKLDHKGPDVEITGHSLGGGLASAASRASGRPATTFNAAGLHENTVARYGGTSHAPEPENIQAYRVQGEALTGLQEHGFLGTVASAYAGLPGLVGKVGLAQVMPDAVGTPHELPGSWDPVSRHMMSQVLAGIEEQKTEDQALLAAELE